MTRSKHVQRYAYPVTVTYLAIMATVTVLLLLFAPAHCRC